MEYSIDNLKLLAQGGEADIYEVDNDKILRILRRFNAKSFDNEKNLFPILQAHQVNIPKVYKYLEVNNRPAVLMQKITGGSLLQYLTSHPFRMVKEIKRFASIHLQLLNIDSDCAIHTINDNFNYFVTQPPLVDQELIHFVTELFEELPKGNTICHGDFHPGNILLEGDQDYIIDWTGAYHSSYLSDIAHTYLLMTYVPELPGQSFLQHKFISIAGSFMGNIYLKEVLRKKKFNMSEFSKWTVVMSFLRINYGLPSERVERIRYLKKCYDLHQKHTDAASWYKA